MSLITKSDLFTELKSVSVRIRAQDDLGSPASIILSCTTQEAFALLAMPCFSGAVVEMIPEYGLPSVSDTENKE